MLKKREKQGEMEIVILEQMIPENHLRPLTNPCYAKARQGFVKGLKHRHPML